MTGRAGWMTATVIRARNVGRSWTVCGPEAALARCSTLSSARYAPEKGGRVHRLVQVSQRPRDGRRSCKRARTRPLRQRALPARAASTGFLAVSLLVLCTSRPAVLRSCTFFFGESVDECNNLHERPPHHARRPSPFHQIEQQLARFFLLIFFLCQCFFRNVRISSFYRNFVHLLKFINSK